LQKSNWVPKKYEPIDAKALQDLSNGKADAAQQKHALELIVNNICCTYHPSFRDTDRETVLMEGRRFVGLEIVSLLSIHPKSMKRGEKNG